MNKTKMTVVLFLQLFCLLLCIIIANRWYVRIDNTKNQQFSVSSISSDILSQLSDNLTITYYLSSKLKNLYPQTRDVQDYLSSYSAINSHIQFTVVNPDSDEDIAKSLETLGVQSQQIESIETGQISYITVYSAIVIEYLGKNQVLPFVLSTGSLEFELTSRVQFLIDGIERKAAVIFANGLSPDTNYSYLIPWLQSSGFTCSSYNCSNNTQSVSDFLSQTDIKTPLLVNGSSLLTSSDVESIESFVMRGGRVLFCVSKNSTNISTDWLVTATSRTKRDFLFPLLNSWGITLESGLVTDISNYRIRMQSSNSNGSYEYLNYPLWIQILSQNTSSSHLICSTFSGVQLYWASPISIEATTTDNPSVSVQIYPLLKTTASASVYKDDLSSDTPFVTDPYLLQKMSFDDNKTQETVAIALEGSVYGWYSVGKSENIRLVVISDQYFNSNMIEYTNGSGNLDFTVNSMLWLSGEDSLLSIKKNGVANTSLSNLGEGEVLERNKTQAVFLTVFLCPIIFALIYLTISTLRRKKSSPNDEI